MYKRKNAIKPQTNVKQKALDLLLYKTRTEKELYEKLIEKGYEPEEAAEALEYVKHYDYVNDAQYAVRYVASHGKEKGAAAIQRELREKGVPEEFIEEALLEMPDEEEVLWNLLIKKAGDPHSLDEKEFRRLYGFFVRRGFSQPTIYHVLKEFQNV